MTAPWATCCRCDADLYPRLARRSEWGWTCAHRSGCARRAIARDRCEDIKWMADNGESATGAAARLGISRENLENQCRRYGLTEQWHRLMIRDPRDHNRAPNYERKAS